jgi:hypothetical protein
MRLMRNSVLATLTVAALSSAAFAQDAATRAPAQLDRSAPAADAVPGPDADRSRDIADDRAPPPDARSAAAERDRDLFCRRDAARRTGYTTPRDAANSEQARGTIGGTLGGAALGAIIGGAAGNAGAGAAIGAGAGLVAGSAIGADNARAAARDVEQDYGDAYYACMDEAQDDTIPRGDDRRYAGDYPPPPPVYSYGPGYYPYPYYGGYPYYGPSLGFSFGFGRPYYGYGYRGGFGFRGGYGGGFRGGARFGGGRRR